MSKKTLVIASMVSAFLVSGSMTAFADEPTISAPDQIITEDAHNTSMHTEEAPMQQKTTKNTKKHTRKRHHHRNTKNSSYSTEKRVKSSRR